MYTQAILKHITTKSFVSYRLFSLLLLSSFIISFETAAQTNPVSSITRQQILATYKLIKDSLLTLPPQPFLAPVHYSEAGFDGMRAQIAKGNQLQVRTYLVQALGNIEVKQQPILHVAASSVWVEYLQNADSLEQAYTAAVQLLHYADSLHVPNSYLAYLAVARSAATLEATYSHSAENAQKLLQIARSTGNKALEAKARLVIGILARSLFWGTSGRSIPHYNDAIAAAITSGDTATLIYALYLKQADITQPSNVNGGFPSLQLAVRLAIASRNLRMIPRLCLGLAITLHAIDEKDKQADMLLIALNYTSKFNSRQFELHMHIQLCEYYEGRRMYDSAAYYINQWNAAGSTDPGLQYWMIARANLYYLRGQYQQSAELYRNYRRDREEAYALHGQNVLSRWEANLRTQEKEQALQHAAIKRRQLTWLVGSIGAVLVVTLLALLWQRSLRRRVAAQNRLISRQSSKLQQSLAEKDILLKEIHHRVKNNLQVIDSLLDMHQNSIHQPGQQEEAFTKARMHVHTIAMIHQNLYQQQNVAAVDMHAFVNDLFAQTEKLYNKHGKSPLFSNQITNTYLDIDTAVPLGLILNELLTNAFKYVLPVVSQMELKIGIEEGSEPEKHILQYQDNGPGLPNAALPQRSTSLGLQLVKQLSRQIGGRLSYAFEAGSCFTIPFFTLKGRKKID